MMTFYCSSSQVRDGKDRVKQKIPKGSLCIVTSQKTGVAVNQKSLFAYLGGAEYYEKKQVV